MGTALEEPLARVIVQATVVVGLSRVLGLAARRLRQPAAVAEIAAGIALGPSLLGWVAPRLKDALFPAGSLQVLDLLGQVGLVLFMFLVGLQLDARVLRPDEPASDRAPADRAPATRAVARASAAVPFALGALLALCLYPEFAPPGAAPVPFALFMGVATSISAFPVLTRVLVERRLLRTRVGAIVIACGAASSVVAWCALALVAAVARAGSARAAVGPAAWALAYVVAMLAVARPLLRKVGQRTATEDGLRQGVVASVLTAMLLSSFVTHAIGLHATFGALAFGVAVPKEGGLARALAGRLEDLVVLLFLPLFLATIGLRTDLGLLGAWPAWGACLLVVAVAIAGKLGGTAAAARAAGLPWREASAVGVLSSTRGLLALAVLQVGVELGLLSPALFTMLVVMALVTTAVTGPALSWVYPPAAVAREPDAAKDGDVTRDEPPKDSVRAAPRPALGYNLLACVSYDRSGPGMATLAAALLGEDTKNRFYALRLVPPAERASFVMEQQQAPDDAAALKPLADRAAELNLRVRPLSFVSAQPAEDICNVAGVKRASLVLLGWHKPLLGNAALGGTVHEVMRRAAADVGVLVDRGLGRIERVLVPYLGSAHDRAALAAARRIVQNTGATATVLHVVSPSRAEKLGVGQKVEEVFQEKTRGLSAQVVFKAVEHASPVEAVLEESQNEYDLVVIGVGPEWGLEHRLFGMQAEVIIAQCAVSLLVLRKGEAAPVKSPSLPAGARAGAVAAATGRP